MDFNRVLLINPIRIRPVVGPIAFDYLGYALEKAGYTIDLIDHSFSDVRKSLVQYFRKKVPIAIGVTIRNTDDCYFQSQHSFLDEIKELINYLKSIQSAPIVLGGIGFSIAPEAILNFCRADFGIYSEGEEAFPLVLKALQTNNDFSKIPNLIYQKNGKLIQNPVKFLDLNKFNPRRNLINNLRYFEEGGQGNVETKRGCDQKCIYCADPICKGSKIRVRDPNAVCAEFKILINQGINCFHLCDSEFNNPLSHAKELCHVLIKEELSSRMKWYTYCAPRPFDEELAQLMKEAGCIGINFGVDSGDDGMLKRFRRSHCVQDIYRIVELCRGNKIINMLDLLIGGPGETRDSIKTTIELMKAIRPDRVGLSIGVRIYPRTALAQLIQAEGVFSTNPDVIGVIEDNQDFLKPIFYLSSELGGISIFSFIDHLVDKDPMFFFANPEAQNRNYNYNENLILVNAIKRGYRGAYWDILRRLQNNELL